MHTFDKQYWDEHWDQPDTATDARNAPVNPYLVDETRDLPRGTALDAGCGAGTEAVWLAGHGWQVTGADISEAALASAADRARAAAVSVTWVTTDLTTWEPAERWDLVTTNYAHPTIPQLDFYRRVADWVAPGGTLMIVGHLHDDTAAEGDGHDAHEHEHTPAPGHAHGPEHGPEQPPHEATVTLTEITGCLDPAVWTIETAKEHHRSVDQTTGHQLRLHDVIVRATRRG